MTNDLVGSSGGDKEWCDHWKQCIWFVPSPAAVVSKDEDVNVHAVHDEISVSYDIKSRSQTKEDFLIALSPERAGVYGDGEWRSLMLKAVSGLLEGKKHDPLCVVADDSVFLTLSVARLSTTSNIASHFPGLRGKGFRYLQAVSDANGLSMERVRVLESNNMLSSLNALYPKKVLVSPLAGHFPNFRFSYRWFRFPLSDRPADCRTFLLWDRGKTAMAEPEILVTQFRS